ncbi:MAG: hypothetical protein H6611_04365 [Ignavibacteriales bacterium]|nr:hypothetical protein [Ignavibacteriales bacterium]
MKEGLIAELEYQKNFFLKTVECLDCHFSNEMYTVAPTYWSFLRENQ